MVRLVEVVIDLVTAATDRTFTYSVPDELANQVSLGSHVRIPFGHRIVTGYVVGQTGQVVPGLKPILAVLAQDLFDLSRWNLVVRLARYNLCHLTEALRLILPPGGPVAARYTEYIGLALDEQETVGLAERLGRRAPAQARLLLGLRDHGDQPRLEVMRRTRTTLSSVRSLVARGAVRMWSQPSMAPVPHLATDTGISPVVLTPAQSVALDAIEKAVASGQNKVFLLHGVTGSGKTEVYLRILTGLLAADRGAIVLVPEIALTPQMKERFVQRFGSRVAILHSGLKDKERLTEWQRISCGQAPVVLGARSAVFAPLPHIGAIILDEEHEAAYKQEDSPRYHARDVALWRAEQHGAVTILGSATPAVASYFQTQGDRPTIELLELPHRIAHRPLPETEIVDMRDELLAGNVSIFSRRLKSELDRVLTAGQQAILLINRRGYSTFVLCRSCGHVAECPHCELALTFHKAGQKLTCHHCGFSRPTYESCPRCASRLIRDFGCGTQRVVAEVKKLWPDVRTERLDGDVTSKKGAADDILGAFLHGNTDVLVGTQMIAKGLDSSKVALAGVISADLTLNLPDPYAWERTFQLLEQVSGRTGRGETPGRAILQTYQPDHISVVAAQRHDYKQFYAAELERRRRHMYPPFAQTILLRASSAHEDVALQTLNDLLSLLQVRPGTIIDGPAPSPFYKIGARYRYQAVYKGPDLTSVKAQLADLWPEVSTSAIKAGVRLIVDVEPLSYL